MENTNPVAKKTDKQFLFETNLNWLTRKKGLLTADDVSGSLHVATPPAFGGEGRDWSPEHLLVGAVSSCLMTTFLFFAQKSGLEIARFKCPCIGQVRMVEGHYEVTQIHVYPEIYIRDESLRVQAHEALDKAQQYCLVSHSLKSTVTYHREILVEGADVPATDQGISAEVG